MNFKELTSIIVQVVALRGVTLVPKAEEHLDRDWALVSRREAMEEVTTTILEGAPSSCREPDRVRFSRPGCTVFVALARPQPDVIEAVLVRPVKTRKENK